MYVCFEHTPSLSGLSTLSKAEKHSTALPSPALLKRECLAQDLDLQMQDALKQRQVEHSEYLKAWKNEGSASRLHRGF